MNNRCCGSIISASRGLNPKSHASNISTPSILPLAFTYRGSLSCVWLAPASNNSSSVKKLIVSTPPRRLAQNSSTLRAPGNRPAKPMMAIPFNESLDTVLAIILCSFFHELPLLGQHFSLLTNSVVNFFEGGLWRGLLLDQISQQV